MCAPVCSVFFSSLLFLGGGRDLRLWCSCCCVCLCYLWGSAGPCHFCDSHHGPVSPGVLLSLANTRVVQYMARFLSTVMDTGRRRVQQGRYREYPLLCDATSPVDRRAASPSIPERVCSSRAQFGHFGNCDTQGRASSPGVFGGNSHNLFPHLAGSRSVIADASTDISSRAFRGDRDGRGGGFRRGRAGASGPGFPARPPYPDGFGGGNSSGGGRGHPAAAGPGRAFGRGGGFNSSSSRPVDGRGRGGAPGGFGGRGRGRRPSYFMGDGFQSSGRDRPILHSRRAAPKRFKLTEPMVERDISHLQRRR